MKTIYTRLTIAAILLAGVALLVFGSQQSRASGVPDTPEAKEIMATIQSAHDALALAYETGQLDVLDEVLIDHPIFLEELGPERKEELRQYIERVSGKEAAQNFGYLTAMKNKITHRRHGAELLAAAQAKATAENRELTEAEWALLTEQNYGRQPSPLVSDPGLPRSVIEAEQYISMEINGDTARVVYERVKTQTALLVRIDGRWYVASML
jgi:hypothetical protein